MSHNHLLTVSRLIHNNVMLIRKRRQSQLNTLTCTVHTYDEDPDDLKYTRENDPHVLLFSIKHATQKTLWDALSFIKHRYRSSPFAINCLDATSCVVRAPLFSQFYMTALMFSSAQALHVRVEDHETADWKPKFWFFPTSNARQDQTCYSGHL